VKGSDLHLDRTRTRGRRVIRRFAFVLLLVPLIPVIAGCGANLPQGSIAQVGGSTVSQDEFDKVEAAYQAAGKVPDQKVRPKDFRTFQQSLAQYLVMLEVLRQEASKYGITVTDQDVQEQVTDIQEMFQGDQKRFADALANQKLTLDQFKESVREELLIDAMKAEVTKDVTVTEDEIQSYYNAHRGDYTTPEVRKARHILIDPHPKAAQGAGTITPTEADWEQAKSQAEQVRSQILNGMDFGTAARKYSDDDATKDNGGDLGSIVRGQMVPEFEEAVFSLREDELSSPVRTEYGYHIIQVTDIIPAAQMPYDQVKEKIKSARIASRQAATWDAWLQSREAELGVVYRSGYAPSKNATTTTTMIPLAPTTTEPAPVATT